MTSRRDEERVLAPDERAPLLGREDARQDAGLPSDDGESTEPAKTTSRTWEYVWKGLLFVLVVLTIAVFVKGWIDADDVDVSILNLLHTTKLIT